MSYTVTIKTLQGASFDLQVEGSFTVKATKEKIATEHAELGSAATQNTSLPTAMVRSRAPSSVHSFAVRSLPPLTKRAPPGSTATALSASGCASMVRSHAPSRHTLTVLSVEPVTIPRPSR